MGSPGIWSLSQERVLVVGLSGVLQYLNLIIGLGLGPEC